jgi:DNA-binding NtrC family response regulator
MDAQAHGRGAVLVVDDDQAVVRAVCRALRDARFEVQGFGSALELLRALEARGAGVDVVLSDLCMPELDGIELLGRLADRWPELPVVVMTAFATIPSAVHAMRRGAYDYLQKPCEPEALVLAVARAVERKRLQERNRALERKLAEVERFEGIVGSAAPMREVFQMVESAAPTDATVLVLGESGTGKELIARAIHERSPRRAAPFVAVNCSALSESLLESELFGYVRGAFTGATASKRGLFEEASRGTLFLDEVGDISPATQVRLLRALQEGEIKPVGASETRKVDVRVIAATNRDLAAAIRDGVFREDLYYRLNVLAVTLPPLRRRIEDIPALAHHFLGKYSARHSKAVARVDERALQALTSYAWPGNVRELENVIQRAVILARDEVLTADLLPPTLRGEDGERATALVDLPFADARALALAEFDKRYLAQALAAEGGNLARAARRSGLDKSNFRRVVRRCGIDLRKFRKQ